MSNCIKNIPVLIVAFNRPVHTRTLVARLAEVCPSRVYVTCDGPRNGRADDAANAREVRDILTNLPWECTVVTRFLDSNRGCRAAVASGISWFFSQVEEGIILEDDCIPHPDFFEFAAFCLEKYRHNPRVFQVSGAMALPGLFENAPFGFSVMPQIWGWATWRHAWEKYDYDLSDFLDEKIKADALRHISPYPFVRAYAAEKFRAVKNGELNTWDYAWFFSMAKNGGYCVTPNVNLVENIGLIGEGTHTFHGRIAEKATGLDMHRVREFDPGPPKSSSWKELRLFTKVQKSFFGLIVRYLLPARFWKKN